jgi:hypothetical protein
MREEEGVCELQAAKRRYRALRIDFARHSPHLRWHRKGCLYFKACRMLGFVAGFQGIIRGVTK